MGEVQLWHADKFREAIASGDLAAALALVRELAAKVAPLDWPGIQPDPELGAAMDVVQARREAAARAAMTRIANDLGVPWREVA